MAASPASRISARVRTRSSRTCIADAASAADAVSAAVSAATSSATASAPASASASDPASSPTSQGYRTFKHLQLRLEYSAHNLPPSSDAWFNRHRDLPCVFREASTYLWKPEQVAGINELFPEGWQSDEQSPLHSLCGNLRHCSSTSHQNLDKTMQRVKSVATFLQRQAKSESLVLSDISLVNLPAASSFAMGPELFRPFNLLDNLPANRPTQTHTVNDMILGSSP
jgi:hypothetical protein